MRKLGASTRSRVPRCFGFLETNFDTGFFTTLGLHRCSREGNNVSKISTVNQSKKGGILHFLGVET